MIGSSTTTNDEAVEEAMADASRLAAVTGHPTGEPSACDCGLVGDACVSTFNGSAEHCSLRPAGRLVPQQDDDECDYCNGSGYVAPIDIEQGDDVCGECGGSGRVPVADPPKED